ncbi:MAG: thiolase domain-containing protein [Nitrososphaerota archaeon]|jgi:acetyl-CoA C-acetyltransferase|nr:thiolase domain-containing protein [Nitrososphaerota archaeon]
MGIGDLMVESSVGVLRSCGDLKPDRVIVGNMFSGVGSKQEHLGAYLASSLGLINVPAYKVEAACGSGGAALHNAYLAVKSGESDAVLVTGVEKMTDLNVSEATSALAMADNQEYSASVGATFLSLNALTHRLYCSKYHVTREELASFPVLCHTNAVSSPHAMFRRSISVDDVIKSPIVSDPIRLLDSAPICDGAASVMVVSKRNLKRAPAGAVKIEASEVAVNVFGLAERPDPLDYIATRAATKRALAGSGRELRDIDTMEVHDAFSITSALALEAMGVSKKGGAPKDAQNGRFSRSGELPINTFGGLKARGHPVGASGVYEAAEAFMQLTGSAGQCQVKGAKTSLIHNMGGVDTTTAVHILSEVS